MTSLTDLVWTRLGEVDSLTFSSKSEAAGPTGWNAEASGRVTPQVVSPDCLVLAESGSWRNPAGKVFDFTNTWRWRRQGDNMGLEHLRFGPDRPVPLFGLEPVGERIMASSAAHVCAEDLYTASLELCGNGEIRLTWKVNGPALKEVIDYCYYQAGRRS
ncbi:MAG: hypothetical protein EOP86_05795 [Verrucomicrobiaceae bacterium]|nr:MAG: hypothetical protein EOP86_05795 [Verrucomicrobiaceae bacterium]